MPDRILFVARHHTYFRNFESVIRLLAARGHRVHLAAERDETFGGQALVERLAAECPSVTFGEAPRREQDEWAPVVTRLRMAVDYLRYLEPEYGRTPRLRERSAERSPEFAVLFGESRWARWRLVRRAARAVLRAAERAIPNSTAITGYLATQKPDLMLITPLIGVVGSPQPDYVRAAKALGIPTALCVWSWDHLSSKALIRDMPDRVVVWNPVQRDEARRLHHVPQSRISVTGAQCFDQWFDRQPSRTREEFCREVGLPVDRPIVLYVGSALFGGSPSEALFVREWIAQLRASGHSTLREAAVLVRPHPQRMKDWDVLAGLDRVAVWGGNPVTDAARNDYFDSLFHSSAVVGLNTSAFLEAGIVGRPILVPLPEEFRDNQEGTIHFNYLTKVGGGLLTTSRDMPEHFAQLAQSVAAPPNPRTHARFLEAFIRPGGLNREATPQFVDAVESLHGQGKAAADSGSWVGRKALSFWWRIANSREHAHYLMDAEDRRVVTWRVEKGKIRSAARKSGMTADQLADLEKQMRTGKGSR